MFQSFTTACDPVTGDGRLRELRKILKEQQLDAVLIPHADEQRNEYLPACAERLAWLSGFTGSAGEAVVTATQAALFVDGRYTLQAAKQSDADHWTIESLIDTPPHTWITSNLKNGATVAIDPWLHTDNEVKRLERALANIGGTLKLLKTNPVDTIWRDQPAPPVGAVSIHDHSRAGRTTREKLSDLETTLADMKADLCVLTDPTSVCWLFNIRGRDVAHTPLVLSHAILRAGEDPLIFIAAEKLDIGTRAFLTQVAEICDPEDLAPRLTALASGKNVALDPDLAPHALHTLVTEAGGTVISTPDPARLPRATKNAVEVEGSRAAHLRDGAAVTTFLNWLDTQPPGSIDEISAARKLEDIRSQMAGNMPLRDISFDTISGSGPNGAIVHYRVDETSNRTLQAGELYLCDSGAQYDDGTTDITRTIAIGTPDTDQRRMFTLVLKGHIGIALARFPKGTRGVDLDVLARIALWRHGHDYAHGTGHGVGSYLSVHEGPQSLSRRGVQELLPGMIISNEPGYYREGAFGIRIENLVLVRDAVDISNGDQPMLGFETLTLAPFDQRLIDPNLLTDDELHWLNAYHGHVRRELTPRVDEATAEWLQQATEPMVRILPPASA